MIVVVAMLVIVIVVVVVIALAAACPAGFRCLRRGGRGGGGGRADKQQLGVPCIPVLLPTAHFVLLSFVPRSLFRVEVFIEALVILVITWLRGLLCKWLAIQMDHPCATIRPGSEIIRILDGGGGLAPSLFLTLPLVCFEVVFDFAKSKGKSPSKQGQSQKNCCLSRNLYII